MNRMLLSVGLLVAGLGSEVRAEVFRESYQFRGRSADAGFSSYDECSSTSAYIFGGEQVTHSSGGRPTESRYAYAYVWSYNWCTGASVEGWGFAEGSGVAISQLNTASLSVPIELYSFSCAETGEGYWECTYQEAGSGQLTATLTGTGDTYRGMSMSQYHGGGYRSAWRSNGSFRAANAAGSLLAGGVDLLAGAVGAWGSISSSNSGSHDFYHY